MTETRPKLLVLRGPHVDAAAVEASLGDQYEIVQADLGEAVRTMESAGCHAILVEAGDFLPLERELLGKQSVHLLDAIGEGVCLCDSQGHVTWGNMRFRTFSDSVRRRVAAVCRRAFARFAEEGLAALGGGDGRRTIRVNVGVREAKKYLEIVVSPVEAPDGQVMTRVAAVVRDVTLRKRMQDKIDAIDRAGREFMHFEAEMVEKLHAAERLKLLEEKVIRAAHDLLQFDHFAVRLLNPKSGELELVISAGMPVEATSIKLFAQSEGQGISGYVAATGQSYISSDTKTDPKYIFGLESPGSSLTVPLRLFDRVWGVFNVESQQTGAFTEIDRQFAEIFAQSLTMALYILRLLVVEKAATRKTATGNVRGELSEPLADLEAQVAALTVRAGSESSETIARIQHDLSSIRKRLRNIERGPQTLLGFEEAIARAELDPTLNGKRVLVVDNEEPIRNTIRDVLRSRGAEVVVCEDGRAAIQLLTQWAVTHDATEGFDLVLSDISMGDITGYDVFAAAKRASENVPVILMTGFGYDPHHSIVRASQEGLQSVMFKPFQAEAMVGEARKAIETASASKNTPA